MKQLKGTWVYMYLHFLLQLLGSQLGSQLDRLWDELHYVSQSALKRVVMLEDLLRTMSGDNPDKVSHYKKLVHHRIQKSHNKI